MPISVYQCPQCHRSEERLEITTEDKAAPPPVCSERHAVTLMQRGCGSCSFADVTLRGTWVRFSSNKPRPEKDRGARSI